MAPVRIKICGLTQIDDVKAAVGLGADAIGLVFYAPSPRAVTVEQARHLAYAAGPLVNVVGLFVNASADEVNRVCEAVPLNVLQFHGEETPEYCSQFNRPYLKALRMRPEVDVAQEVARYSQASGLLLDAYRKGIPGGTGETFDWARVPQHSTKPIVLAGGLSPDNIRRAVAQTQPYGVDVSGGVERSHGIKDFTKIAAFIANAKAGEIK